MSIRSLSVRRLESFRFLSKAVIRYAEWKSFIEEGASPQRDNIDSASSLLKVSNAVRVERYPKYKATWRCSLSFKYTLIPQRVTATEAVQVDIALR